MPTIIAPKISPRAHPKAGERLMMHRVMAFMLWPKKGDQTKRKAAERKLGQALMGNLERRTANNRSSTSKWSLREKSRPQYQSALIQGLKEPWLPEYMPSEADSIARYVTASLVAYYAMAVNPHTLNHLGHDAAVGVACAIVNEFDGLARVSNRKLIHKHAQAAMIDWGKKKRAAHFWAAYLIMKVEAPDRDPIFNDFRKFVGLSRHFRQVLQTALIRSTGLLRMPKGYRYQRVERHIQLDQELMDLLPFYRSDGDLGPRFERPSVASPAAP